MGGAAGTMTFEDDGNAVLAEGQPADVSKLLVPLFKGSPVSKTGYEVGYKIGE